MSMILTEEWSVLLFKVKEQFCDYRMARGDVYIVFGGFYKLPGLAGFGYSCCYETEAAGAVTRIPYDRQEDDWVLGIVKRL